MNATNLISPDELTDAERVRYYGLLQRELLRRKVEEDAEGIKHRSKTLAGFVQEAWAVLEPANPYVHNWHIDAICAALEGITFGQVTPRLLINVPPGTMKSLLVSVFWPAWEWGPCDMPHLRYIATSYAERFTKRDSRRMRDLVMSDWYRALWPKVKLLRVGETSFSNSRTGWREAIPFQSLTGGRGDRVLIDDPHSTETAESDAQRESTLRILRESVPLRVVDADKSAIIVIMQRLHEKDVSGWILSQPNYAGYETIILPMEYDGEDRSTIAWAEERTEIGELLFPKRFSATKVKENKSFMGSYAIAGQYQQRPAPRGGGLLKRNWFTIEKVLPLGIKRGVRWWDLAASVKSAKNARPDYTVGLLMFAVADGTFWIVDVERFQGTPLTVEQTIKRTAITDNNVYDRIRIMTVIPEDPGAGGKFTADRFVSLLAGFSVKKERETKSKELRLDPVISQAEAGKIKLLKGLWNEPFLDEVTTFPSGENDDQVDALSGAFKMLTAEERTRVGAHRGAY